MATQGTVGPHSRCQRLAQTTAMLTGVSSAEAREAAALEGAAAKRRCLEESLESPAFAKTAQISGIRAHEGWRRLVACLPPGNPQCPMQLLRPS